MVKVEMIPDGLPPRIRDVHGVKYIDHVLHDVGTQQGCLVLPPIKMRIQNDSDFGHSCT